MIKTATLTGALLDYWTARAEGVPAEQLEIRQVQRTDKFHVVHTAPPIPGWMDKPQRALNYQDSPTLWAPLIEKHRPCLEPCWGGEGWYVRAKDKPCDGDQIYGDTPQEAICRAVVRAAFGDEVEDVPCK